VVLEEEERIDKFHSYHGTERRKVDSTCERLLNFIIKID
jgi:hypothetical protein